nr:hypothetical protein [Campylobacter sp.]
ISDFAKNHYVIVILSVVALWYGLAKLFELKGRDRLRLFDYMGGLNTIVIATFFLFVLCTGFVRNFTNSSIGWLFAILMTTAIVYAIYYFGYKTNKNYIQLKEKTEPKAEEPKETEQEPMSELEMLKAQNEALKKQLKQSEEVQ